MTQEFTALHPYIINYKSEDSNKWYNEILTPTLTKMVSEGLKINHNFQKHFDIKESFSIKNNKIYGWYNFCTTTGRPTNNFNKINFSALKHDSGERDSFEADNDILIEMDYEGYHPRIIAHLIGHHIDNKESVHTQLAKMYFETEEIDSEYVLDKCGVPPSQYVDWKALVGDVSDGIPGIKGIGKATAVKLLKKHQRLEAIPFDSSEDFENAQLWKKLIELPIQLY